METSYAKLEMIVQRSRHMSDRASTVVSRVLDAPREAVYRAYLDRDSLAAWLPPDAMTGVVHTFDAREGGAFSMSLVYPEGDRSARGKTTESHTLRQHSRGRAARRQRGWLPLVAGETRVFPCWMTTIYAMENFVGPFLPPHGETKN